MLVTLTEILAGNKTTINSYDYRTNSLCPNKPITIYPADVVLFEGILVFYFPAIRDLFHMKLFVDTDSDTRLARRGKFKTKTELQCTLVVITFIACSST